MHLRHFKLTKRVGGGKVVVLFLPFTSFQACEIQKENLMLILNGLHN